MTGTARDDAAAAGERQELISCLERVQDSFERRALASTMAEPLISTPLTMQQLKVLTMIAIDPDRATDASWPHSCWCPSPPCPASSIDSLNTEW